MKCLFEIKKVRKACSFLGGVVFGTAGIAVLASDEAKKVYAHCTAAGLRAKDKIMEKATAIQENAGDIYADAKDINMKKKLAKETAVIDHEADC